MTTNALKTKEPGKERLFSGGLAWLLPALFLAATPDLIHAANMSFVATMKTTIAQHRTSMAEMVASGPQLRLKVMGGRTFSTMIANYNTKILWLMAPSAKQYKQMSVADMGRTIPQFFRPGVTITKKRVAEEVVADRKAVKYEAKVQVPGIERPYDGELWEAVDLPGYPLKWVDPEYQITVVWLNARLSPRQDDQFSLPADYTLIAEAPRPANKEALQP